ncbi:MAG: hypothetical protein ABI567_02010 [Gammaproteobacteria bacterium]
MQSADFADPSLRNFNSLWSIDHPILMKRAAGRDLDVSDNLPPDMGSFEASEHFQLRMAG